MWHAPYPWDVRIEKFILAFSRSFEVSVLCKGRANALLQEESGNLCVYRVQYGAGKGSWRRILGKLINTPIPMNPYWIARGVSLIRRRKPALIIGRDMPIMWLALVLGRLFRIPVVYDMAENYPAALVAYNKKIYRPFLIGKAFLPRLYEKVTALMADHVVVVAGEQKERLMKLGIPGSRITVVLNTPIIESEYRDKNKGIEREKIVLYTGKIDAHRGVDVAVRAMADIIKLHPDAVLVLAGSGTQLESIKELSDEIGVRRNVRFAGWLAHKEVYEAIEKSSVCIIPHLKSEHTDTTIPNKLFDYMLCGKPVVSSDLNPVVSIISSNNCGLVFKSGRPESLAEKVVQLLSSKEAVRYGENGRMAVKNTFNWGIDSERLINAVKGVLGS